MERYILRKTDLNRWVELMIRSYSVFAPIRAHQEIFFSPLSAQPELDLLTGTAVLPFLPPKDIVFPQSEVLFSYARKGEELELTIGYLRLIPVLQLLRRRW